MHKVGDKFVVVNTRCGFRAGQVVTLNQSYAQDRHDSVFAGDNDTWKNAYDEDGNRIPGAWMNWENLTPYEEPEVVEADEGFDFRMAYMLTLGSAVATLQAVCYDASVRAGWWNDLKTGEAHDPVKLGPEKIALMHSELSEALEGLRKGQMDDKLPHRPMAEVELADCIIRALDWAGAMGYDVGGAIIEKLEYNASRADHKIENRQKSDGKKF